MAFAPVSGDEAHLEGVRSESIQTYRNLVAERDRQLKDAKAIYGPESDRWKRLAEKRRNAEELCSAIYGKLLRPSDAKRISLWATAIGIVFFGFMEMPVNKFMLDNLFQTSNFDSYVLSFFLTLCLLILAHVAGLQARQIRESYEEKIYWANAVAAVSILFFLSICVGALTIGRALTSAGTISAVAGDVFTGIKQDVAKRGLVSSLIAALSDNSAFFLACFNTAGITLAFFSAFISVDSDKVLQAANTAAERAEKSVGKMEKRYTKLIEAITTKYNAKLSVVAATYTTQNAKIIESKKGRGAVLEKEDNVDITVFDPLVEKAQSPAAGARTNGAAENQQFINGAPRIADDRLGDDQHERA